MEKHKCVLCGKPKANMEMFVSDNKYLYYHYACGENKELIEKYNKGK